MTDDRPAPVEPVEDFRALIRDLRRMRRRMGDLERSIELRDAFDEHADVIPPRQRYVLRRLFESDRPTGNVTDWLKRQLQLKGT